MATVVQVPTFYVAGLNVQVGGNDVRILGGHMVATLPDDGKSEFGTAVQWTVALNLSPHTAKMLAVSLAQAVRVYESQFGELKIPELPTAQRPKGQRRKIPK